MIEKRLRGGPRRKLYSRIEESSEISPLGGSDGVRFIDGNLVQMLWRNLRNIFSRWTRGQ